MSEERGGSGSKPNVPLTDTPCGWRYRRVTDGWKEKNVQQLLTSLGLFFAGATPVNPDRNRKKKKGEGYQCTLSISSMFIKKDNAKRNKKGKKKER